MSETYLDPVATLRARPKAISFHPVSLLLYLVVFVVSLLVSQWEYQFLYTDLHVHAVIASEFDFTDLHSITSRLAYPMWHLLVAALYQAGVALPWAAAIICALAKTAGMWLARLLLGALAGDRVRPLLLTLAAFLLMFVTGLRLPWFNPMVYKGVGSPTVWHNPTQLMVIVSMLLCVPYTVHLWYEFTRRLPHQGAKTLLPWPMVLVQMVLTLFSLACKPTFMQALLPAAALFFLVQWIRHPANSRYFLQIILSFLPAAGYFLLQYLYYTGVVVPFTSGVELSLAVENIWPAIRSMLLMAAFPLFAILCCYRKGYWKDQLLVLTLLLVAVSVVEAMLFRETGVRQGHGNFNWASMSSALMLWVVMLGKFIQSFSAFLSETKRPWYRWALYGTACLLLLWHVYSGGHYLYHLLDSNSSF